MEAEQIKKHFCCFSEAIRAGIPLAPQGVGTGRRGRRAGTLCALEAGLEAMTGRHDQSYEEIAIAFPYMMTLADCPDEDCFDITHDMDCSLIGLIWRLNDHHEWTREQIADWLESEEEKLGFVTVVESAQTEVSEVVMV